MTDDLPPELRKELLDDFYAECDELLSSLRVELTAAASVDPAEFSPAIVEAPFRAVHSLKGIAAIAGVSEAERVAHAMEDLLRALSRADIPFSPGRFGRLIDAAQHLERIIVAHRLGKPCPASEAILEQLREAQSPAGLADVNSPLPMLPASEGQAGAGIGLGSEPDDALSPSPSHLVRVDLNRLDELMRITGELVVQQSRLEERIEQHCDDDVRMKEISLSLRRSFRDLSRAVTRARLVPVEELFSRIPFVLRDLALNSDKSVQVAFEGRDIEIDKYLVERLKAPMLHLVRNAFSHGIEPRGERAAAGKPPQATLVLGAESFGESIIIHVRDDGRGIDDAAVAARAKSLGVRVPDSLDAGDLLRILCLPGFSTQDHADRAAGRGVGMAVVANTVQELGGALTLTTKRGYGTEFTLRLPLTLSIIQAIILRIGPETCAIPQSAVEEIIRVPASEARTLRNVCVVPYRDGLLPVLFLRRIFHLDPAESEFLTIVVSSSPHGTSGLVVDRALTRREIVVRPLIDPLVRVPGVAAATELGDGRPILILDPHALHPGAVRPSLHAAANLLRAP